ncbi:MAG: DinB family protein [Planctomycetes bacterium]|nr:DinB family protein [Planctomycetota bacterium]
MAFPAALERLFDYDDWANREVVLHLAAAAERAPPHSVKLLAHVIGASRLWLSRLRGESAPLPVWPAWSLEQCVAELAPLRGAWRAQSAATPDAALASTFAYVNSKGERFESVVADVLHHVALHGTHHRAQLLAELRATGIAPPLIDYIHAVRSGALEKPRG